MNVCCGHKADENRARNERQLLTLSGHAPPPGHRNCGVLLSIG